jgi:hypothetical protein
VSLTPEEIFASRKGRKPERLEVPEWGGHVFVRVMSVNEQLALFENVKDKDFPVSVLLHAVCDEEGKPIFSSPEHAAELANEDFPIVMKVFRVAAKLNGFSNKELEGATESFKPAPGESSSTE